MDDDIDENNEVFDIVLTTTETGISLAPDQGMVTIVDNDSTFHSTITIKYFKRICMVIRDYIS